MGAFDNIKPISITLHEYRFVAPGWTDPEGRPTLVVNVGEYWRKGHEILQEHVDWFALYMDELAKEWAAIRDRGDHTYTNVNEQTGRREPAHEPDQRCICAERAEINATKTRTAERTQLVRLTIRAD